GTLRRSPLWQESWSKGQPGPARNEAWQTALGPLGKESHQPEAGNRNRLERSPTRRWQGPIAPQGQHQAEDDGQGLISRCGMAGERKARPVHPEKLTAQRRQTASPFLARYGG